MEQQDQFYGDRFDSSSDAGSDTDTKVRHPGAFSSLNNFPFNMEASPCSSVSLDIDAGDFFDTLNMSGEFVATDGATEWFNNFPILNNNNNNKKNSVRDRETLISFYLVASNLLNQVGEKIFSGKKKNKNKNYIHFKGLFVRVEQKR